MSYDLAIIGGGPAGYTAAFRAVENGMSVILFEKDKVGGTCLNRGCIPTKTLLHSSGAYSHLNKLEELGVSVASCSYDYSKMLEYHKEKGADCTIAVIDVPIEEASRFGIMSTNEDGSIYKFSEKPKNPDSTNASMGIYIFNRKQLCDYLIADEADPGSSNDFGKNIIPNMLAAGEKMFAYPFEGYWKDVGTISSLWEANMDLLGNSPVLDLSGNDWRIFARHSASAPQFVGARATIENCYITEGCEIYGTVKNSVIGPGVKVMAGAHVEDCVLMGDCVIEADATVQYAIIDSDVVIGAGATVGAPRATGAEIAVVGENITIAAGATVEPGAMLSE